MTMDEVRADAIAARTELATHGWIPRNAESFRHLPPPDAPVWLEAAREVHVGTSSWRLDGAGANVQARWLDAADREQRAELLKGLPSPDEHGEAAPFAWAHRALVRDGLRICVGPAWTPTVLRLARESQHAAEAPLLVIELLPGAHCVLVETHTAQATQNVQVHLHVGARAQLDHLRIVRTGAGAQVAHHVHARLAEGSRYEQRLVATGAAYHLQRTLVDLDGRGGEAGVRAVLLADGVVLEQQVRTRHAAAATRSDFEMLALGSGSARMVGNAFTSIAPGCDGADVRQRLAGIPTSGQPKLVLRPHLEIHHDDVQAAHGATWGALPEDALFHARQRGLGEAAAKMLIVEGLARSVFPGGASLPDEFEAALAGAVRDHLSPSKEPRHG
jgi:Fe-S cluster assembly protein SufD